MDVYHFKNFEMLDPEAGELRGGHELVVEGDTIREVSAEPLKLAKASIIDCGGRTLMPGLIDSHVHVVLSEVVIRNMESVPLTLMTARAAELMRKMLDRGFTSVRDTGGADWGLKEATDKWLLPGPRLFIAGRAIGPTGGHSDGRRRTDLGARCQCCNALSFAMGRYVCAHAYTPQAITRAANAGVRTIEHGNLIDDASAKLMAEKGMFLVANLVTYFEMKKHAAAEYGMNSDMLAKNDLVIDGALKSLEICKRHGVPVAYGTDLLGQLQVAQSNEFTLRSEVLSPAEIIRSATTIGAEVVRMEGKIGCLKPGAFADLIVVDGNPLLNLKLLQEEGRHLSLIMKGGRFHKNRRHL